MSFCRQGRLVAPCWGLALLSLLACDPESPDPGEPDLGKVATTSVSVTGTTPSSSPRDTTLDVQVSGSGFDLGSAVVFTLDGVVDARVRVNATRYLKASALVANVTIAADAVPDRYDVMVTTSRGKKGIGTELFAVLAINAIPDAITAHAVTAEGLVAGSIMDAGYVWSVTAGMTLLTLPAGLDSGATIGMAGGQIVGSGRKSTGGRVPVRWTLDGSGWTPRLLELPATGSSTAWAVNAAGVFVGGVIRPAQGSVPVRWDPSDALVYLPIPCANGNARGINSVGTAVGYVVGGAGCSSDLPAVWPAAGGVLTPPLPPGYDSGMLFAINTGGSLVGYVYNIGVRYSGRAALWRPAGEGQWQAPIILGTLDGASEAHGITDDEQVVGWSVNRSGQRAWHWDAARGMKPLAAWGNSWSSVAEGISVESGRIVGRAYTSSGSVGVWWPLP